MSYSTSSPSFELVPSPRRVDFRSWLVLAGFIAASAAVAAFGTVTTISSVDGWYADAVKVAWNPPNWLFGPVWSVLYLAMAVAAWLVWRRRYLYYVAPALALYVGQLFLNSVWTPVFFGGFEVIGPSALWLGVAVIVMLDVCVAATIVSFWAVRPLAAYLLLPYFAWILYATTLNIGLAVLNA